MEMMGWGAGVVYGNPEHLIVFISGYGRPGQQTFHFQGYGEPFPQTKLFLRDHENVQFEKGILGLTENEDENLEFLRYFIKRIGAKRVTFVSGSVGTHPTIVWGHKLGVNDIHLIGPVTDMAAELASPRATQQAFFPVRDFFNRKMAEGYPHANLRNIMRDNADKVDCIDLYFGREDPIDSEQAAFIQDLPQVRTTLYHQGDHFRVPMFVQRRDPDLANRIMAATVDRPADLRKAGKTAPIELGYAAVRLL